MAAYKDEPESSENTRIAETVGGNRRTCPQTRRSPAKTAGIVLAIGKVLVNIFSEKLKGGILKNFQGENGRKVNAVALDWSLPIF